MFSLIRALLDRDNLDIGLVTSWQQTDLPKDISERLKSYTHQVLVRPRVLDVLRQAMVMPGIARRLGADIILNIDPIGTPLGSGARITVVHDIYFKMMPSAFSARERLFSDLIMRWMVRGSQDIICISERTKRDLDEFYPFAKAKSRRIYSDAGVDVGLKRLENKPISSESPVVWVGKITANKNIVCLYQAMRILSDRGLSMPVVIVGNDVFGYADTAEKQYGSGLPIRRLGCVSDSELVQFYAEALCFVNTSTYEGFGMPVIEAQRLGLPVICSTGGAVSEIAGEGALTFDPDDPATLANHLALVASSPEIRHDLVAKGYENAKRFSWSTAAEKFEELIFTRTQQAAG